MAGRRFPTTGCIGIALLGLVSTAARGKELQPTSFPAKYSMELDPGDISTVKACAIAGPVTIHDSRDDTPVGERAREKTPTVRHPIKMTGDAAEWVRAGFNELARQSAFQNGVAGKPDVTVALADVRIVEMVYRMAEYHGRVVLDISVIAPGGGSCWSERVEGFAENYGRAGKEVNYQETVNHALDRAFAKTFGTLAFVDALCSCGGSP